MPAVVMQTMVLAAFIVIVMPQRRRDERAKVEGSERVRLGVGHPKDLAVRGPFRRAVKLLERLVALAAKLWEALLRERIVWKALFLKPLAALVAAGAQHALRDRIRAVADERAQIELHKEFGAAMSRMLAAEFARGVRVVKDGNRRRRLSNGEAYCLFQAVRQIAEMRRVHRCEHAHIANGMTAAASNIEGAIAPCG